MRKIYLFGICIALIITQLHAQKAKHEPLRRPILTEVAMGKPHLVTQEQTPVYKFSTCSFKELAEYELAHPVKYKKRAIEQGEDLDEKYKWAGNPTIPTDMVNNKTEDNASGGEKRLINSPAPLTHWTGVTDGGNLIPPDIRGAAGPTYVMETTNQDFRIYTKAGVQVSILSINTFFSGSGGQSGSYFDPHIVYDPNYSKWIVIIDGNLTNGNGAIIVAVSQTSDPTGSWWKYSFDGNGNTTDLLDYPLLGYNKNWVVVSANNFLNAGGVDGKIYTMNRASLYSGTLANLTAFTDNNAFCWAPAQTQDTTQLTEWMVQEWNGGSGTNKIGSITGTPAAPVYNAGSTFAIASHWSENSIGAPQSGNVNTIDAGDTRVGNSVYINNSLWFCETVWLPSGNSPTHSAVQWMQITPSTRTVIQMGRAEDVTATNWYYYGAINVNTSGDVLLGHCTSSSSTFVSADYSFRAGTDAANTLQTPYSYKAGLAGYFKDFGSGRNRWGDYTAAAVDPVDNSFWGFSEWAGTGNHWETEIVHVSASCSVTAAINTFTNILCNGASTGGATATASLGTTPYTYIWSNGPTTAAISNVAAGTYTVTIHDAGGCSATATKTLTQPNAIVPTPAITNVSCNGGTNGAITLTVTGGTGAYTYNWGGGITTQNRTNLTQGTYNVMVTDANLCTAAATAIVTQPAVLAASTTHVNVACNGANTGTITLIVTGGTTAYTYNWGGGIPTQNRTNIAAGTYNVTVTDANLCTATATATVTQPNAIVPTPAATNILCNGGNNGAITLTTNGGTGVYTYNWGGGITTQNRTNLTAGTYTVTITDAALCRATSTSTITQPNAIVPTPAVTNVLCNGGNNGAITLTTIGGTGAYTYNWGGGITTQNRTNLMAGTYTVTVTDANLCTAMVTATVTQPLVLAASTVQTNISCSGGNNGAITLTVTGGTTSYTYNWGGGITTQNRTNLTTGTYTVTVTDTHLCTAIASTTITQPAVLAASTTHVNVTCNGGSTGTITLTVTGGTTAYTYNWGGGVTTQNRTNLMAGTYTVTVTDANLCTAMATATVTQPNAIVATPVTTNVSCNGGSNGAITLTVTGGTGTYTYNWGGGITTQNRTNLAAGTYTVTITDAALCTATSTSTITQPNAIVPTPTVTNVLCNGGNNGAITLTTTGGTGAYTYNWGGGITAQNRTNLIAGTYTVTVTDANLCTGTTSCIVTQPVIFTATTTHTNVSCNGGSNATIILTVTGGTTIYTYNWGGGVTTQNRTNLAAGTYTVTVTDAHLCTATANATITQPQILAASTTATNVLCNGGNTGTITLTVTGGITSYTYNWGGGITTQNRTNLSAGTYTVTVTDANLCTATASGTVTQTNAVSATTSITNVSCFGGNNGAITLTAIGGTGTYTYNWGGGVTTQNRTNLIAGTYTVTVTDGNSCTASATATVTQPQVLVASTLHTNVLCNGGNNATITLTITGGTTTYTYNWGGGVTAQNRTNLAAGTYTVTVTDAHLCTATANATITEPNALLVSATGVNASCAIASGSAVANASGGIAGYTYLWSTGATSASILNLSAATYSVTSTDNNVCTASAAVVITNTAAITLNGSSTAALCFGSANGSATVSVITGTSPYNYIWSNGGTGATINNLISGTYVVTVSDNAGCSAITSQIVSDPTAVIVSASSNATSCGLYNGSANSIASGGISSYTYIWSTGETTATISNIGSGTYTVTASDANSCMASASTVVNSSSALSVGTTSVSTNCFGGMDGSAIVTPTNGTSPFNYSWSNGETVATISNLIAGTYTVTVQDSASCSATATQVVSEPNALNIFVSAANTACGLDNGSVAVNTSGGTSGYTYLWSNAGTGSSISNLVAGTYSVTVTDAHNCSSTASGTVGSSSNLTANTSSTEVNCSGSSTGTASVTITNGTLPFAYLWSNGGTSPAISNISAGSYNVTITDSIGCSVSATQIVTEPSVLSVYANSTSTTCGQINGSATTVATGGAGGYIYLWSDAETTDIISNVVSGTYFVTVTDNNGCSSMASTVINASSAISVSITSTIVSCFGGADGATFTVVFNGTAPYQFVWSNGGNTDSIIGLEAGTYNVTITDSAGCSAIVSDSIAQPAPIAGNAISTNDSCFGNSNGTASVSPTGGNQGYSYLWSSGETVSAISNLPPGRYFVTITDANNCIATDSAMVTEPTQIQVGVSTINATSGQNNGSATVNPNGGTPPYTFNWSNSDTSQTISNLGAGTYDVTITDANGCTLLASATITQMTGISNTGVDIQFTLFPNPADNQVAIEVDKVEDNTNLSLKNVLGQAILNQIITSKQTVLNLSAYAVGVYYIEIRQGDKKALKQIEITR